VSGPDELLAKGKQSYGWTLMIAKLEGGNANALTCRQAAIAIQSLSAANAALAARCVPREPTKAMLQRFTDVWPDGMHTDANIRKAWRAMYDAALASQGEGETG
jgi:hypothetical protein